MTRTNMSTEQPFDTDQPLFQGTEGNMVEELVRKVGFMEGGLGSSMRPARAA